MSQRMRIENPAVGKGPMLLGFLMIVIGFFCIVSGRVGAAFFLWFLGIIFIAVGKAKHWFWN